VGCRVAQKSPSVPDALAVTVRGLATAETLPKRFIGNVSHEGKPVRFSNFDFTPPTGGCAAVVSRFVRGGRGIISIEVCGRSG